jgi:RNA polymerase sigma factor (sigma-70 family)
VTIFRGRADLLQQFRDGDRVALETIYRAYVAKVVRVIRYGLRASTSTGKRGTDPRRLEDLGDLVQETFLRAFAPGARSGFDGVRDYAPYLFTVARNVLVDWARRRGREVPTEWPEMETLMNREIPFEDGDPPVEPRFRSVVESYLAELTPELRAVHQVRYERGLSQVDGAAALGISRQSLRTLEMKLRTGLRRALKRSEIAARRTG